MDKYGVVTDQEATKIASKKGTSCPGCGGTNVDHRGSTPHCSRCGTKPWERKPSGSQK